MTGYGARLAAPVVCAVISRFAPSLSSAFLALSARSRAHQGRTNREIHEPGDDMCPRRLLLWGAGLEVRCGQAGFARSTRRPTPPCEPLEASVVAGVRHGGS